MKKQNILKFLKYGVCPLVISACISVPITVSLNNIYTNDNDQNLNTTIKNNNLKQTRDSFCKYNEVKNYCGKIYKNDLCDNSSSVVKTKANVTKWPGTDKKSNNVLFKCEQNIYDLLNKYIIGDISSFNNFFNISITVSNSNQNFLWRTEKLETNKTTQPFGMFWKIGLLNNKSNIEYEEYIKNDKYYQIAQQNSMNFYFSEKVKYDNPYGYQAKFTDNSDYGLINSKNKITLDFNNQKLYFENYIFLEAQDHAEINSSPFYYSNLEILDRNVNLSYVITMPYTSYDLNEFINTFKSIFEAPIRIKDSKTPVIFDYLAQNNKYSENEQYVRNEFINRVKKFYRDPKIQQNKFGRISINGNQDTSVSDIELIISPEKRGKIGNQKVTARFYLKNNRYFKFNYDQAAKNYIECQIPIFISAKPEYDYKINDLISITPYVSADPNTKDNYLSVLKPLNIDLNATNSLNPKYINTFSYNINQINANSKPLIPRSKFPIISKLGTNIKVVLDFETSKISTGEISKITNKPIEINFDTLFTNGEMTKQIILNQNDYVNSLVGFENNMFEIGIKMYKDQVLLFTNKPITLIGTEDIIVKTKIKEISATIPSEQATKPSKWVQIKDGRIYEQKNLQFVGEFETFDPFIFKLTADYIKIKDPITNESLGYASKYKPFIRQGTFDVNNPQTNNSGDENIFSSPQTTDDNYAYYLANLGDYVMKKKQNDGKLSFQIVIKEFDQNSKNSNLEERYTIDRWIIGINMNLFSSQAQFKMIGYENSNEIQQTNKDKFFNKESPYYRGDYIDEKTGMYKPKIVWVNALPPESFLYDPLDENGQKIVGNFSNKHDEIEASKKANYHIGYIAQLNANGFSDNDYTTLATFGGYSTIFDEQVFTPNGLTPYSESYIFDEKNIVPNIIKTPIATSGLQTIKSLDDFKQIVLKRDNTNNYLYQFIKIAKSSEEIDKNKDLIDLYGKELKGLNNEPLFVDFFSTYEGRHLIDYLTVQNKIFANEEEVKKLNYNEIIQYWNIYVNDPGHYSQNDININSDFNISKYQYLFNDPTILNIADRKQLEATIIKSIEDKLNYVLSNPTPNDNSNNPLPWIDSSFKLINNLNFEIENSYEQFSAKVEKLISNWSVDLMQSEIVEFNVKLIPKSFTDLLIKPVGQVKLKFFNNKDSDKIINLANENGSVLSINTNLYNETTKSSLINKIKQDIYKSVELDLNKIISKSSFNGFKPVLNQDYKLYFYTQFNNNNVIENNVYHNINSAINDALLFNTNTLTFYNTLSIKVCAIFDQNHKYMINSFDKLIVNNSRQNQAIIEFEPYDLRQIKNPETIKINTQDPKFDQTKQKAEKVFEILINYIKYEINFYARKLIDIYNLQIQYQKDFEIKLIKSFDSNNNPIFYETQNQIDIIKIIDETLIQSINNDPKFNKDLYVQINGINNSALCGKYIKKINNCYLNDAIQPPNIDQGLDNDLDLNNPNNHDGLDTNVELENKNANDPSVDMWWIITPITVFTIILIGFIITILIRKKRKIA